MFITDNRSFMMEDPTNDPALGKLPVPDLAGFYPEEVVAIVEGGRAYGGASGDIGAHRFGAAPVGAQLFDGRRQPIAIAGDEDDGGAGPRQRSGDAASDARVATGHDGDQVVEREEPMQIRRGVHAGVLPRTCRTFSKSAPVNRSHRPPRPSGAVNGR